VSPVIPSLFVDAAERTADSWHPVLLSGLSALHAADAAYLPALSNDTFLPTQGRLFAAFGQPLENVRYVLVGEGPYPREERNRRLLHGWRSMRAVVNAGSFQASESRDFAAQFHEDVDGGGWFAET